MRRGRDLLNVKCKCFMAFHYCMFFLDCWEHFQHLVDVRNKHFVASFIKDLFDTIEAHKIIDFIKETRFYKQL